MKRVTGSSTPEEIGEAIKALYQKERKRVCEKCAKKECKDCLTIFHAARNSAIRILRNIFHLPIDHDVPAAIFHLASEEANNIILGEISPRMIKGIKKLQVRHFEGSLIKSVPENEVCLNCGKVVPPSRTGYVINGPDPVCWECELNRSGFAA